MSEAAPPQYAGAEELRALRESLAAQNEQPPLRCPVCKSALIFMEGWNSKRWFAMHPRVVCRLRMTSWGYAATEEELREGIRAGKHRRESSPEMTGMVREHVSRLILQLWLRDQQKEAREAAKTGSLFDKSIAAE